MALGIPKGRPGIRAYGNPPTLRLMVQDCRCHDAAVHSAVAAEADSFRYIYIMAHIIKPLGKESFHRQLQHHGVAAVHLNPTYAFSKLIAINLSGLELGQCHVRRQWVGQVLYIVESAIQLQ